jgi:hypothetical protein
MTEENEILVYDSSDDTTDSGFYDESSDQTTSSEQLAMGRCEIGTIRSRGTGQNGRSKLWANLFFAVRFSVFDTIVVSFLPFFIPLYFPTLPVNVPILCNTYNTVFI